MRVVVVQLHLLGAKTLCSNFSQYFHFIEFIGLFIKKTSRLKLSENPTLTQSSISFINCKKFGTSTTKGFFLVIYIMKDFHNQLTYNNVEQRNQGNVIDVVISSVFINFEQISHLALVFLLLSWTTLEPAGQ